MARRTRKVVQRLIEIESPSPSAAIAEKILLALKPDRDITPGEFLKRAFQFPQIDKIVVQKFSVGTWNFAEDLGNLGPTQDTSNIEAYLKEKYGAWRFRLLAIVQGEAVTQCVINLDGWQESEGRAAASAQSTRASGPVLGAGAKPAGPGATSELLAMARERIEIENTQRLLQGLATGNTPVAPTQIDVMTGPVKVMMEMMTGMMGAMKEMMTVSRGGLSNSQEDRFLSYLQGEIQFLREQMKQPQAARDPDALTKTITTIDNLLQSALGTSLAEVLTKTPTNEATGWAATIQGIIEGVKPHLADIMGVIRQAVPSGPRALGPANVIPIHRNRQANTNPEPGGEEMKTNPDIAELLNLLIDALKKKEYLTVDAILTNPPMRGQFNINPNTPGSVYAVMFKVVDPRFGEMGADIQGYLEHVKEEIAKAEADEAETD